MKSAPSATLLRLFSKAASLDRIGMSMLRLGLIVVLIWIGGLKFADYEADSIVPLIANSPLMSFVYAHPAPEYHGHMNKEGEVVAEHHAWQVGNRTYTFSNILGCVIVLIGLLIACHWKFPQIAAVGSALLVLMACTTLSFLVTTPEAWVPALGSHTHGFPFLSGVGRLIIKDSIMLGAAVVTMADSAKKYLKQIGEI
ncbi:YkgB family protein [Granulicella arctica]|uniref:YkgB family protein n=1 Tax=Granulicella arctica TaxID=940613 RepID=UPI0021E05246|nr:YkgB family protein [Granulicella arctica]